MKTRVFEKIVDRRLRYVIQRRRWFRWRDLPEHTYPNRMQAINAKFKLEQEIAERKRLEKARGECHAP